MTLSKIEKFLFYNLTRSCIKEKRPIGSKFLSKKIGYKLSPPSLRIYLRKIVKNGYLENVSLEGRVPTDKGWYFYLKNYKIHPELKIDFDFNSRIERLLERVASLTKNIFFLFENGLVIKGLKNAILVKDRVLTEDWLEISEKLEKIIENLENEITILIGSNLVQSKTKNLSLIAYKNKKRVIGFLGPKINYYHTNIYLLENLIPKNE